MDCILWIKLDMFLTEKALKKKKNNERKKEKTENSVQVCDIQSASSALLCLLGLFPHMQKKNPTAQEGSQKVKSVLAADVSEMLSPCRMG